MKNVSKRALLRWLTLAPAAALLALSGPARAKPQFQSLTIDYETSGIATVGQPYPVTIVFSHVTTTPPVKVTFSADKELKLSNAKARTLPEGQSSITVMATPSANGRAYVNVFTRQGSAGTANSIPVQVGPEAPRREGEAEMKAGFGTGGFTVTPIP